MERTLLKSKIHRATVTAADLHYEGSITIDRTLMDLADLNEFEQVDVYNITSGTRLTTYVIPGAPGLGDVQINGAAAHLVGPGDLVIVASYARYTEAEAANHRPQVILVDGDNQPVEQPAEATAPGCRFPRAESGSLR